MLQKIKKFLGIKQGYLNWNDYSEKITQIEHIYFIHNTAKQSINNYWNNLRKRVSEGLHLLIKRNDYPKVRTIIKGVF